MERTVKDVMPALETNSEGLKKVLDDLVKQYKRQQEDMEKWKVCDSLLNSFSGLLLLARQSLGYGHHWLYKVADFILVLEEEQHTGCTTVTCSSASALAGFIRQFAFGP